MVLGGNKQDEAWQDTLSKFFDETYKDRVFMLLISEPDFLGSQTHTLFKHWLNG